MGSHQKVPRNSSKAQFESKAAIEDIMRLFAVIILFAFFICIITTAFGTPVAKPEAKPEALPQKNRLNVFNCPCMEPCLLKGLNPNYCQNKCIRAGKCTTKATKAEPAASNGSPAPYNGGSDHGWALLVSQ